MERVSYLLTERNNPYAPLRSNGMRGWYVPTRTGGVSAIRVVGIHTTESDPTATSALNVARWQAFDARAPSSYHVLVDSDHHVRTLPDTATAFHIGSFNTPSVGLSFATRASWWGRFPAWDALALEHGAIQAADWCKRYSIPRRWLTRAQAIGGQRGFVRHSTMDPSRRSDPGLGFPADVFLARVNALVRGVPPPPDPEPDPEPEVDVKLFRIDGGKAVYVTDGTTRSHVPSREVLDAMGWKLSQVEDLPADHVLAQLPELTPLVLLARTTTDTTVWEFAGNPLRRRKITGRTDGNRQLRDADFLRIPADHWLWRTPEA